MTNQNQFNIVDLGSNLTTKDIQGIDSIIHLAALSNDPLGEFNPELTNQINLDATIYVAKESQKRIVIGEEGAKIKSIGTKERIDLEEKYKKKVFLSLWCKVKKNWINDPVTLESFGIKN